MKDLDKLKQKDVTKKLCKLSLLEGKMLGAQTVLNTLEGRQDRDPDTTVIIKPYPITKYVIDEVLDFIYEERKCLDDKE